ncbi:AdoMet-dependent rRNA methyltransferase SPB1 [Kwoniella bestiolae CBS 10118]|uniref:AdoMet-dependent rRNA methyltransferase SPB1 n=1 Tax=Kwoniella bestiolae CBS 10118 TaxID=1296100 RepID=A0A1B9FS85_9TREE|nr:AdoMet-dependent rRNA methyltransferase SPB1 [Kwoniella bestiolae CBS 10118]OCF21625.1 AdoMet-dependent rRNA methyltransferase SPB1 [Kwoniella bestiolae CBS 10118]
MGKHDKKTGKGRLDKFYRLAKEQGYRARSAFKLVHLNRKYDLLSKSKCVIDLCAAPGGWLQVAEKYMPKGSLIIGVDLNPIKPLPHVTTFVSDITTPHCRQMLKQHMHDWKADLVMHDGAPNVGSAWVQDAFTQNELVLQSLKLATEFLVKGGNFVTKVFRSQDYNSLMWVFGQLFKSVEATKPPSSRNVSAEIFVVCRDFIAPKHIDPKFLDPKHVFKDLAPLPTSITDLPNTTEEASVAATQASTSTAAAAAARLAANSHAHSNVFAPEKKRRHREGYADGDYTLYHTATATDFIKGVDPVLLLGGMNKITFDSDEEKQWLKSRHTTPDVIANCNDLKVLGKGDFKALMKWRLAIRLEIGLDVKAETTADATEEITVEPIDEEEQITEDLKKLQEAKSARTKRERKRANEKKAKDLLKLQLNMTAPEDLDTNDLALKGEEEIFDLEEGEAEAKRQGKSSRKSLRDIVNDEDGMDLSSSSSEDEGDDEDDEVLDSDEERERKTAMLEGELDGLYETYKERMQERDAKWKVKNERNKDKNFDAWHGIRENGSDNEDEEKEEEEEEEEGGWDLLQGKKADDQDSDSDSDDEDEGLDGEEEEEEKPKKIKKREFQFEQPKSAASRKNTSLVTSLQESEKRAQMSRQAQLWFDQSVFKGMDDLAALDGDEEEDETEVEEDDEDEDVEMDSEDEEDEDEDEDDEGSSTLQDDRDDVDFEIVPQEEEDDGTGWDVEDEDQDEVKRKIIKDKGLLTAEAVTLATSLVNRQITASQLIDQGFNKLSSFNKDGLPSWFLDDESKYYKPNIPITKEAVEALKARQRALDARPIKKVAEAKQRKKFKAVQRMEKAKRKADDVMGSEEMGDGEKARQVRRMLAKAARGKQKAAEKKIVVAKGVNRGVKGRPKGVKGKYKIVDSRMRKEVRALKRIKKANKKR